MKNVNVLRRRNELATMLKLSERKRNRFKAKAKSLSSQDLVEVLQFRSVNQDKMQLLKGHGLLRRPQLCRFNVD